MTLMPEDPDVEESSVDSKQNSADLKIKIFQETELILKIGCVLK
jgi:hypothetical protein